MRRRSEKTRRAVWTAVALATVATMLGGAAGPARASGTHTHFRYGHYTWVPLGGTTIEFTLQNAFRRNGYSSCYMPSTGTFGSCSGSDGLPAIGDIVSENIGGTVFETGDGGIVSSPTGALLYLVTSVDPASNWLFGLALDPASLPAVDTTITHTYPTTGNFLAFTWSCCRISSVSGPNAHINNPDGDYRVETLVNVGTGNRSPVSALPPIVSCPQEALCSFTVPAGDADGDALKFRLSTALEASGFSGGFTQPGPPYAPNAASIDPTSGVYTWNTVAATLGPPGTNTTLYSTQVTIEDLAADGITVKSKVALDFLIRLVPDVGDPPGFDHPPTPACGSTLVANVGNAFAFTVQASDSDAGQTVTLNAVGIPVGATMTPALPTSGNPVSSAFSWTPTAAQVGTYAMTFAATDSLGLQALCSVILQVVDLPFMTGRATVVRVVTPLVGLTVADTGEVATAGASTTQSGPPPVADPIVAASGSHARVETVVSSIESAASVAEATLAIPGGPLIEAAGVRATSSSSCLGASGAAEIGFLAVDGTVLIDGNVTPAANTSVVLGDVTVTLNEQAAIVGADFGRAVRAVHVVSPAGEGTIAFARSAIDNCPSS